MTRAIAASIDSLRIGFIGAGRLGQALAWSLAAQGLKVVAAASQRRTSAQALAAPIPGCRVDAAQALVDDCDLVFLTTPDAAIEPSVAALRWRAGVAVVHCSGVTEVAALASAAAAGAQVGGFHPMQTFGDPAVAARSLPGCTITIEAGEPLDATLVALAERLQCRTNRLPPGMRARYHAAAGYTSQFINVLFADAERLWRSWGASEAQAVDALLPLARGTLAAIEAAGIARAMPGPVSRGDLASIEKHLQALVPFGDEACARYRILCRATVPLAQERGAIDAQIARRFEDLLAQPSVADRDPSGR
ncbi:MAG: DUF2520 domain-containing protein [Burkholderiales bacterium]|nr:DUF2520 domain-containing protein [Burkholderiales bacterium]